MMSYLLMIQGCVSLALILYEPVNQTVGNCDVTPEDNPKQYSRLETCYVQKSGDPDEGVIKFDF